MSIISTLSNLAKAGIAMAVSPVALVADIATLPSSAYNDTSPFGRTGAMLSAAGKCITQAVKAESDAP